MPEGFAALAPTRKIGDEPLHGGGAPLGPTLRDFWRWSASDLVSNTMRGLFAEYLVASALGLADGVRAEWEPFDLKTEDGIRIEVKSAAYIQSWFQRRLTPPVFGIAPTRAWDPTTGLYAREARRQADLYVFSLLHHRNKTTVDPLDVNQWTFYLLPTTVLDERYPKGKSMTLTKLLTLEPISTRYEQIADTVACLARLLSARR